MALRYLSSEDARPYTLWYQLLFCVNWWSILTILIGDCHSFAVATRSVATVKLLYVVWFQSVYQLSEKLV